jgi:hypothetical protein
MENVYLKSSFWEFLGCVPLLHGDHTWPTFSRTYRQVLWGKSAKPCQVPPGGSVELLHLLCKLLLEAPLLFVLLSVSKLHHNRWRAALWLDTLESEEEVTAWLNPFTIVSIGSIFLNYLGAWNGLEWFKSGLIFLLLFAWYHQQKIPDSGIDFFGGLVVGEAICFFCSNYIKLPLLLSSCVFLQLSRPFFETKTLSLIKLHSSLALKIVFSFVCLHISTY